MAVTKEQGCDDYCEDSTFRSCIPNGVIDFSCMSLPLPSTLTGVDDLGACTLSGLQDIANVSHHPHAVNSDERSAHHVLGKLRRGNST